jgi:protein required for attachment to host cells
MRRRLMQINEERGVLVYSCNQSLEFGGRMSRQKEVWYVIADGAKARVVRRDQEAGAYHAIRWLHSDMARLKSSELVSDRLGRVMESSSTTRHAAARRHDPHREAKLAFARETAERINHACQAGELDGFVLVAPSRILGEIRKHLASSAHAKLISELAKDLTPVPDGDLGEHLDEIAHRIDWGLAPVDRPAQRTLAR